MDDRQGQDRGRRSRLSEALPEGFGCVVVLVGPGVTGDMRQTSVCEYQVIREDVEAVAAALQLHLAGASKAGLN
jgi:hypothetical protein